jgi:hypothetical protein
MIAKGIIGHGRQKRPSFLKNRSKKPLPNSSRGPTRIGPRLPTDKSLFASFSSEKEESLT